jgi:hypothetical protein
MPVWQELLLRQDHPGQRSQWVMLDAFLRACCWQPLQLGRDKSRQRVLLVALPNH